jgi:hypothetical protein
MARPNTLVRSLEIKTKAFSFLGKSVRAVARDCPQSAQTARAATLLLRAYSMAPSEE